MRWSPRYQLRDNSAITPRYGQYLTHAHNHIRNTCEGKTTTTNQWESAGSLKWIQIDYIIPAVIAMDSCFTLPTESLKKKYGSEALLGHATRYHGDVNLKNTILTGIMQWPFLTLSTHFLVKIDHPLISQSKRWQTQAFQNLPNGDRLRTNFANLGILKKSTASGVASFSTSCRPAQSSPTVWLLMLFSSPPKRIIYNKR